jgi:hypothetical protein
MVGTVVCRCHGFIANGLGLCWICSGGVGRFGPVGFVGEMNWFFSSGGIILEVWVGLFGRSARRVSHRRGWPSRRYSVFLIPEDCSIPGGIVARKIRSVDRVQTRAFAVFALLGKNPST